jgi:hypothetical protein
MSGIQTQEGDVLSPQYNINLLVFESLKIFKKTSQEEGIHV